MSGFDKSSVTLGSKSQLGSGSQTVNLVLTGEVRVLYCPHKEDIRLHQELVLKTSSTARCSGLESLVFLNCASGYGSQAVSKTVGQGSIPWVRAHAAMGEWFNS